MTPRKNGARYEQPTDGAPPVINECVYLDCIMKDRKFISNLSGDRSGMPLPKGFSPSASLISSHKNSQQGLL
ncbi:MAG: hypothetical protein KME46_04775 [Brasilonema angustatum HA4187-MV1]|jgi:hypothetical protein|nr:hypothetical protein [Brasilonema angustatum HA4187-MV1]